MKTSLLLMSVLTVALAAGCDRKPADEDTTPAAVTAPDAAASTPPVAEQAPAPAPVDGDALALGLLQALNGNEIAAAKQAEEKKVSAPVLQYAQMMEKDHGDNQMKAASLGMAASTDEVQAMKDKGKAELDELGTKSGQDYETAYVDAMVKGHTDALALIDGRLQSLASTGPVKDHLIATRGAVAMHLEAAQKLQASQSSAPAK